MCKPRRCFVILEEQCHPEHGYIPSVVTENETGHAPLIGSGELSRPWFWGKDIETARRICAEENMRTFGVNPETAREILHSSIAASIRIDAGREAHNEDYERKLGRRR